MQTQNEQTEEKRISYGIECHRTTRTTVKHEESTNGPSRKDPRPDKQLIAIIAGVVIVLLLAGLLVHGYLNQEGFLRALHDVFGARG